jgi:hypothetical protein
MNGYLGAPTNTNENLENRIESKILQEVRKMLASTHVSVTQLPRYEQTWGGRHHLKTKEKETFQEKKVLMTKFDLRIREELQPHCFLQGHGEIVSDKPCVFSIGYCDRHVLPELVPITEKYMTVQAQDTQTSLYIYRYAYCFPIDIVNPYLETYLQITTPQTGTITYDSFEASVTDTRKLIFDANLQIGITPICDKDPIKTIEKFIAETKNEKEFLQKTFITLKNNP